MHVSKPTSSINWVPNLLHAIGSSLFLLGPYSLKFPVWDYCHQDTLFPIVTQMKDFRNTREGYCLKQFIPYLHPLLGRVDWGFGHLGLPQSPLTAWLWELEENVAPPLPLWLCCPAGIIIALSPSLLALTWLQGLRALRRRNIMGSDMWASEGFIIHSEMLAPSQVSSYVTLKTSLQWGKQTDKEHQLMTLEGQRAAEVLFF